jgi:hypothetical protein
MKIVILLITAAVSVFCQDSDKLILYGNMGIGISKGGYQESKGGPATRLGISANMFHLLFKFDRTINNEISLFKPPEKITSYSTMLGVTFQPFPKVPEMILTGKFGIGNGERIKRGNVVTSRFFDDDYEFISEKYSTRIVEFDVEFRFQFFGIYMGGFSEFNDRFTVYGATFGAIVGTF